MPQEIAQVLAAFSPIGAVVGAYVAVRVGLAEVKQVAKTASESADSAHKRIDLLLLEFKR